MKRYLVIYDSECGICTALANWLKRKDKSGNYEFAGSGNDTVYQVYPIVKPSETAKSLILVDKHIGRKYKEARAVFEILKHLPGFYSFMGHILANSFFGFLFAPAYRLVAENRRLISRILGYNACSLTSRN